MPEPSPTVRRRRLAMELRRLLDERHLSPGDVETRSKGVLRSYNLSRWLSGRTNMGGAELVILLDILAVDDEHRGLLTELNRQARKRGWWQSKTVPEWFQIYLGLEAEAQRVREYAAELIPGLLQTREYYQQFLKTIPRPGEDVDSTVNVRMARQNRVISGELDYWAVLNESVLLRLAHADDAVAAAQAEHLLMLADKPNVCLQVLPVSAGLHPAMEGAFSLLSFPEDNDVVYLEYRVGSLVLEENPAVDRFAAMFDGLIAASLSMSSSRQMIEGHHRR